MTLEVENIQLRTEIKELKFQLAIVREELGRLKKMVFGSQSERSKSLYYDNGQMQLFTDEKLPQESEPKKVKVRSHEKVKVRKPPKRVIFPADLPRAEEILNPAGIDEIQFEKIGEDITEILAYKPGEIYVKRTIRPRWVRKVEADTEEEQKMVLQEPIPARLIPRGMVDESLIAHMITEKFLHHMPVYRLAKKYKQIGVDFIGQRNMHNWIHQSAGALKPLYDLLIEDMRHSPYLQGDESTLQVLSSEKRGASHTGYMWLIHNPEDCTTLFHYDPTRQHR